MKRAIELLTVCSLFAFSAGAQQPAGTAAAPQTAGGRTDVYHVHFTKAALGKATALADSLKKQAQTQGNVIILRHQSGDVWDYAVIQHLGPKVSLDAAGSPPPPGMRDLSEMHMDTYVSGPPWQQFATAMGLGGAAQKTAESVYIVSTYRAAPGHREQLEKVLAGPSDEPSAGSILLQHLEGGPWNFLSLERYNSWQEYAASETKSRPAMAKNQGGWFDVREHTASHADTLADRIAP